VADSFSGVSSLLIRATYNQGRPDAMKIVDLWLGGDQFGRKAPVAGISPSWDAKASA